MTTPADDAVAVDRVSKNFGSTVALADVSFSVQRAERFGFIGPDGAGKTTLFRILATLMAPDQGRARVLGRDVSDLWTLRARIGYMPGRFSLYPDLSVDENLRFFASVFGTTIEREYQQIAPIYSQLEPFRDRRAAALSGGMKQKLALCCALVHQPEILVLDEPTRGVDALSRREFWELLADLKRGGLTTLVSTPYMDEANRCDRIALIHRGQLQTRRRERVPRERSRAPGEGSDAHVRRFCGRRPHFLRRTRGRGLRLPRCQRRGQDDGHADAHRAAGAERRHGARGRPRRP